jgi:hypothetical protein
MPDTSIALPDELIEDTILLIRRKRVILDHDLARLYGVATKALNQAVKRNLDSSGPYAFTEQGVAML